MNTTLISDSTPDRDALADEEAVMANFAAGTPVDPEVARRVHERAMKLRDEIHRHHGVVDIGTPAMRELRGDFRIVTVLSSNAAGASAQQVLANHSNGL